MAEVLQKVLDLSRRQLLMLPTLCEVNGQKFVDYFDFGPAGVLFKHNVFNEWMSNNVLNTDRSVFPCSFSNMRTGNITQDFITVYNYVKTLTNNILPFGLVETLPQKSCNPASNEHSNEDTESTKYFRVNKHTSLRRLMFSTPEKSTEYFHSWQRQRRIWWRKLSTSPGRFSLTDIRIENDGQNVVDICAEFPWGKFIIETVKNMGSKPFDQLNDDEKQVYEAKDGRKKVIPHVIESVTSLDCATFTFLCDAYDEIELFGLNREVLRFHTRLAPYKTTFATSTTSSELKQDLEDLAIFLTKEFRQAGISTLLLPDVAKKSLESQFMRNDELGIPYTVVLNDATSKTGIAGLRSRDTTLKEQVHVTKLTGYLEKLLKH